MPVCGSWLSDESRHPFKIPIPKGVTAHNKCEVLNISKNRWKRIDPYPFA